MGMLSSSPVTGWVDDQMVVSVGPYMLTIEAFGVAARRSLPSDAGKASPPTMIVPTFAMAARLSSPARIMVICEGVHCRCVTPWRATCAASE